jgi:hypothetical protein
MRRTCITLLLFLTSSAAIADDVQNVPGGGAPPPAPEVAPSSADSSRGAVSGTVTETMDAGRYTYAEIDTGKERVWAAGPTTELKVGDRVSLSGAVPAAGFFSKSLDRKFDLLYLAGAIDLLPATEASSPSPHETGEIEK